MILATHFRAIQDARAKGVILLWSTTNTGQPAIAST